MHLGHLVPFLFTAYLQRAFNVPCVIQLTDDEKFLYKGLCMEECQQHLHTNVRDIIACGFHPAKTYIFSNFQAMGHLYPQVCRVQRHLTCSQVRATFGIVDSDSPGKMAFPAVQMVPALGSTFADALFGGRKLRCLIPCGMDQDPYFRLTRDVATSMGEHKPAVIQSKFLPSLRGIHTKMSSSDPGVQTVELSDNPKTVQKKINKAFSGGRGTAEEQRMLGANLQVDVPLRYLHCFGGLACEDGLGGGGPDSFREVDDAYAAGHLLSGEVKKMAAQVVSSVLVKFREARDAVSDEDLRIFMSRRPLV